jgi:hypothetical protein
MFWSGAAYFALIGAAFMFLEIALIQRLSVFLGHPTYALGILLFTLIGSTGLGSWLSDRLPLTRKPWCMLYPCATVVGILCVHFLLGALLPGMVAAGTPAKAAASILVISPLGLLMGMFFPAGMRLVRDAAASETPWYWAVNGIFGVLSSAVAVLISIHSGISTNLFIAAVFYAGVLICIRNLRFGAHA